MLVLVMCLFPAKSENLAAASPRVSKSVAQVSKSSSLRQAAGALDSKIPPASKKSISASCDPTAHVVEASVLHDLAIYKGKVRVQLYLAMQNLKAVKDLCQEVIKSPCMICEYYLKEYQPGDIVSADTRVLPRVDLAGDSSPWVRHEFEVFDIGGLECDDWFNPECQVKSVDGNGNFQVQSKQSDYNNKPVWVTSKMTPSKDWHTPPRVALKSCQSLAKNAKSNIDKEVKLSHTLQTMEEEIESLIDKFKGSQFEQFEDDHKDLLLKFKVGVDNTTIIINEMRKDKTRVRADHCRQDPRVRYRPFDLAL